MSDHEYPNKIDLLDDVLTAYRQVDPPAGLEARILGRIEENLRRRRLRLRFLLAATAGATGLSLALFLMAPARIPLSEPTIAAVSTEQKEGVRTAPPAVPVFPRPAPVPVKPKVEIPHVVPDVADAAAPRQPTFPAPSAPSDQERALISLMQLRRQILLAMWHSRPPEIRGNIDIVPIEIYPLVGGDGERSITGK